MTGWRISIPFPANTRGKAMFELDGKVAIVTGGGSGIGSATSQRLQQAGAAVVVADVADCRVQAAGWTCDYQQVDVSCEADLARLCDYVMARYGHLDILVNNAAISSGHALAEADRERSRRFWEVNVMGAQMGMREAAARMAAGGSIINLSSITAARGFPQWSEYGATKGAIMALTQTAAIEYAGAGIRVNCICPGIIDTPMAMREAPEMVEKNAAVFAPLGRIGQPAEIASAIHFLASDDASYITGQVLLVDGGWSVGTSLRAFQLAMSS